MKLAIYRKNNSVLLNLQYFSDEKEFPDLLFDIEASVQSDLKIDKERLKKALKEITACIELTGQEKSSPDENI